MESSAGYITTPAQIPSPSNEPHIYHEIVSLNNDCEGSEEIRTSQNPRGTGLKNQMQTGRPKSGFFLDDFPANAG